MVAKKQKIKKKTQISLLFNKTLEYINMFSALEPFLCLRTYEKYFFYKKYLFSTQKKKNSMYNFYVFNYKKRFLGG